MGILKIVGKVAGTAACLVGGTLAKAASDVCAVHGNVEAFSTCDDIKQGCLGAIKNMWTEEDDDE